MTHADALKNRQRSWIVIVAVTLSAAVVFWAVERVGDNDENAAEADAPASDDGPSASEPTSPVQDYLQFARAAGDPQIQEPVADPEYIVEGLRKLAGALGTLNIASPDLQTDLRVAAEHLLLSPASTATTAVVRDRLISAADAIEAAHGGRQATLRRAAEAIEPDRPLLDQQAGVREFFRESANAIQSISRQP